MSKPQQKKGRLMLAVSVVSLLTMAFLAPAALAQSNSPSPGQPGDANQQPASGGPSNQSGSNTGGDGQAGNRSTPGGGGATGGGAGAPSADGGGGGSSAIGFVVAGVVLLLGAGIFIATREKRLDRVEAT
jgi:hypothetical protein